MMTWAVSPLMSYRNALVFWWILFLIVQQSERLFLLPETLSREIPPAGVLIKTLLTGLRADLIAATGAVAVAAVLGGAIGLLVAALAKWRGGLPASARAYRRGLMSSSILVGILLLGLLLVDMGYYGYNQQHLDFVFFEYLDDLLAQPISEAQAMGTQIPGNQAAQQTGAEIREREKWVARVAGFLFVECLAIIAWWFAFRRRVEPALVRWETASRLKTSLVLGLGLVVGATGFHPQGPYAIRIVDIGSAAYYTLAQNPILYAGEALRAALFPQENVALPQGLNARLLENAVRVAQEELGSRGTFPSPQYPFVHTSSSGLEVRLNRPANVLLLFIEGLDRRYLGRTILGVRGTPFLDRLREESIYFENFFANGVQTARGLFASFCSYYPYHGPAAMKTRYTHDYLCLPSVLSRAGYRTEMVVSQHRDINRLHLFLARNGLQQLFDESDFPRDVERMSLGITDGALLDFIRARVEVLQGAGRPFFLATLTLGMHHPFAVPQNHPEVRTLQAEPDGYVAALRYLDLELERFFGSLLKDGLLKNTVVFVLGDHGRHEPVGRTDFEKQAGHFLSPLFIWMAPSLRAPATYRPRVVHAVASQVDLAPTILALNGLGPRISPFVGRDLSCLLVTDCLQDNVAFLSSVYDDLIGLVDRDGLLLYSLRTETLYQSDLGLQGPAVRRAVTDPALASRYQRLLALYTTSNMLLERNRIWSWKEFGGNL